MQPLPHLGWRRPRSHADCPSAHLPWLARPQNHTARPAAKTAGCDTSCTPPNAAQRSPCAALEQLPAATPAPPSERATPRHFSSGRPLAFISPGMRAVLVLPSQTLFLRQLHAATDSNRRCAPDAALAGLHGALAGPQHGELGSREPNLLPGLLNPYTRTARDCHSPPTKLPPGGFGRRNPDHKAVLYSPLMPRARVSCGHLPAQARRRTHNPPGARSNPCLRDAGSAQLPHPPPWPRLLHLQSQWLRRELTQP